MFVEVPLSNHGATQTGLLGNTTDVNGVLFAANRLLIANTGNALVSNGAFDFSRKITADYSRVRHRVVKGQAEWAWIYRRLFRNTCKNAALDAVLHDFG